MAKSKNHTNRNQNRKDHRNGIKRPKRQRQESSLGVCAKFLKNLKYSRKHNLKPEQQLKRAAIRKAYKDSAIFREQRDAAAAAAAAAKP